MKELCVETLLQHKDMAAHAMADPRLEPFEQVCRPSPHCTRARWEPPRSEWTERGDGSHPVTSCSQVLRTGDFGLLLKMEQRSSQLAAGRKRAKVEGGTITCQDEEGGDGGSEESEVSPAGRQVRGRVL